MSTTVQIEDVAVSKSNICLEDIITKHQEEPIVKLVNIHKTYLLGVEGVAALRGISLEVFKGEWVAVYGTSGGGKTSLLNVIGTIDKPTKGDLKICGTVINANTKDSVLANIRLNKLGFVFQSFNLLPSMTARENVELPMTLKGVKTPAERRAASKASLEKVGLAHRMTQYPAKLSGGEQQRVAIARAISNNPEVLLLDEPTGDLDTVNTLRVLQLLHRLNTEENMTMIMVTHDEYLKNFAHKVIFMRDGKIAKIKLISLARRQQALNELYAKMEEVAKGQTFTAKSSHETTRPNREVNPVPEGWTKTEIRDPGDYLSYSDKSGIPPVLRNRSQSGYFVYDPVASRVSKTNAPRGSNAIPNGPIIKSSSLISPIQEDSAPLP